jgi:hypothetical protein
MWQASHTSAKADDCDAILKYGIFDFSTTSTESSQAQSYLNWLASREFHNQGDAKQGSASIGITLPIEGIPVGFNPSLNQGSTSTQSWGSQFSSYVSGNVGRMDKFTTEFKKANKDIIDAWINCIKNQKKGLHVWAVQTGNRHEIKLMVEVIPLELPFPGVTIKSVTCPPNVKPAKDPEGTKIAAEAKGFLYTRTGPTARKGVNFIVETDNDNYTASCYVEEIRLHPVAEKTSAMPQKDKKYYIQTLVSRYYLDVKGGSMDNAAEICQAARNQKWEVIPSDKHPGYYFIKSIDTKLFLDVFGGNGDVGGRVDGAKNQDPNQVWRLIPSEEKDYFYIQTFVGKNYNLDVLGGGQHIGDKVGQAPPSPHQVWRFIPAD